MYATHMLPLKSIDGGNRGESQSQEFNTKLFDCQLIYAGTCGEYCTHNRTIPDVQLQYGLDLVNAKTLPSS